MSAKFLKGEHRRIGADVPLKQFARTWAEMPHGALGTREVHLSKCAASWLRGKAA